AVLQQVGRHAIRGIGKQRRRVQQGEIVGGDAAEVRVLRHRLHVVGTPQQFAQLNPVQTPGEGQQIEVKILQRAHLLARKRGFRQVSQFPLQRGREVLALVQQGRQQNDCI